MISDSSPVAGHRLPLADTRPAFAIWLTGLPASGKSSIGAAVADRLRKLGLAVELIDSDRAREFLTPSPTYQHEERELVYRALAWTASRLVSHGVVVVLAATAPSRRHREWGRTWIERFLEVQVTCSPEECCRRDPRGLYARARRGQATTLPGVQTPYEPAVSPEVTLDTERDSLQTNVKKILQRLADLGWLKQ